MSARFNEPSSDADVPGTSDELAALLRAPARRAPPGRPALYLGQIASVSAEGNLYVQGIDSGPVVLAQLAFAATLEQLQRACQLRQPVVLMVECGESSRTIAIGLIQLPGVLPAARADAIQVREIEANVDTRRVQILGEDEIELRCGAASITLRRNGRVIIRGTYIETDSQGTNRIKGGQVRIN